ncbi:hypothetical protein [Poseidonibacter ostreae]|uniref:Oligosaccharide repeat unit polymerase n=1 Tax=Poseidonibacter ostreae TaxID=2654171 RepID=A0ABQ6VUY6_9BACT|nr:hypothetical protein [Poseidonibacter ostreae]KAB7892673.1 hypothetical protein GBG18_02105 [Poseidonibacter ostreae]
MIGSLGWSILTSSDLLFFIAISMIVKMNGLTKYYTFLLLIYSLLHLIGGARLMTITGIIMIVFIYNNFFINLSNKLLLSLISFVMVFIIFGALRSGEFNIENGFLEFGFVGFGYYNLFYQKDLFDIYIIEFIHDIIVSSIPLPINKYELLYRNDLILNYFYSAIEISPVGGSFFLTEMYLYLGVLSIVFIFIGLYITYKLIIFYHNLHMNKFKLIFAITLGLYSSYFLVNFMRNYLPAASSMQVKIIIITLFFMLILKSYKINRLR